MIHGLQWRQFASLIAFLFFSVQLFAQQDVRTVDMKAINAMKAAGKLTGKEAPFINYEAVGQNPARVAPGIPVTNTSTGCNCWLPRDASWQIAAFDGSGVSGGPGVAPLYRNDDWSTVSINLPFNFCFYGTQITAIYINNNGNVSINAPYSTFNANSFPDSTYVMIAPFWADVDTRGTGSGVVYYKLTPTYLAVQWDAVGYFNSYFDKVNTFQLIMTDGVDPILTNNSNVSFCYKDMQWTTGDASGGSNGFGGTAATVGVNKGNGIDYIQIGLFDTSGTAYDGPYGNKDGVDVLDFQSFLLNVCFSGTNVPPIVNAQHVCDTIPLCEGDTLLLTANYLSPEQGQITTPRLVGIMQGLTATNIIVGNTASITAQIVGLPGNLGMNQFDFIATDNGVPVRSTRTPVTINVLPRPAASFTTSPTVASPVGTPFTFTNTSTAGTTAVWDFGDGSPTSNSQNGGHIYTNPGTFTVSLTVTNANGCHTTVTQQVTITACASASFTASSVCAGTPVPITFTGSAAASDTYAWNFAGGTVLSGSGQGPYSVVWNSPGTYNLSLTVTLSTGGCTSPQFNLPLTIKPNPVANFTATGTLCQGQQDNVNFIGTAAAGATFTWNFGSATTVSGSGQGPYTIQYNTSGPTNLQLIITQNGCADTMRSAIQVNPNPTATFTLPAGACTNAPVNIAFTGTALATANYTWDFGGGTVLSGTGAGPYSVSWNSGGNKSVTLLINQNGCSATGGRSINITAMPVAAISATPSLCTGTPNAVTFTGTATGGANFTWSFGNATVLSGSGQGPYSVQWASAGSDFIRLTVSQNGCVDTSQFAVQINPVPVAAFALPAGVCAGAPATITFTGTASGSATYNWNFDGGTVLTGSGAGPYSVSWNSVGAHQVSLNIDQLGCTNAVNHNITVNAVPDAAVSAALPAVCTGQTNTITFTGSAPAGATYTWNFGNATVVSGSGSGPYQLQWTTAGTDVIRLTVSKNGCTDSTQLGMQINPIPVATFTAPPGVCAGDPITVNFTGTATAAATYSWNFAGGRVHSGSGAGPYSVSWDSAGSPVISLSVSQSGCSASGTRQVTVHAVPVAAIAAAQPAVCIAQSNTITFTGTALPAATYTWNFGNATVVSGSGQGPYVLQWSNAGTDQIRLTVSQNGCADSTQAVMQVNPIPTSAFTATSNCAGAPVTVNYTGTGSAAATYNWGFGTGTVISGSGQGPYTLSWNTPGNYSLTLTVTERGCVSPSGSQNISVYSIPVAHAGNDAAVCSNILVQLGTSPLAGMTYHWYPQNDLSDPDIGNPTATIVNAQNYTLSFNYIVTVSEQHGCSSTDTVNVQVYPTPVVDFPAPAPQCIDGNNFLFEPSSNIASGALYHWTFGTNANPPSSDLFVPPSVSYSAVGTYPVTISASYNNCPGTPFTDSVTVNEMPLADFMPQVLNGCQPLTVPFSNLSSINADTYSWNFNDGTSRETAENPVHVFVNPGVFSVGLTATTAQGCVKDTIYPDLIQVYQQPRASFDLSPAITDIQQPIIQFINSSLGGDHYLWDFGDSLYSNEHNVAHSYADTGTYQITLVVSNIYGCVDTVAGVVRIEQSFSFYIPNAFTPNGDLVNDVFRGLGTSIKNYDMTILDRWGKVIYHTNDYDKPWDGKVNDAVQNDVYVYKIRITDLLDQRHEYVGSVAVIR